VAGRKVVNSPTLAPGEVYLSAAEGAGILLKTDGSIELTGNLSVKGSLTVQGAVQMRESVALTGTITANGVRLPQNATGGTS